MRLRAGDPSVVMEAVQQRRPVVENQIALAHYPLMSDSPAYAALAAPLRVSSEVVGAISFVHTTAGATFDDDAIAQVTILAAQLCSAIEALRLDQFSREERRRTAVLFEVATELHGLPDASLLVQSIADRLRDLLRSPVVLIFVQHENLFQLQAVSAEVPRLVHAIRARSQENNLRSALEIASRAVTAGQRITVNIDGASHFGEDSPPGTLIAAPFRTSRSHGAILAYPRLAAPFAEEDKTLLSALAGFVAIAITNAELHSKARAQAQELHDILDISCELSSAGKLDEFMQASVVRAASFLGYHRCFIGLLEDSTFHIRWTFENGQARPVDIPLHDGVTSRRLKQKKRSLPRMQPRLLAPTSTSSLLLASSNCWRCRCLGPTGNCLACLACSIASKSRPSVTKMFAALAPSRPKWPSPWSSPAISNKRRSTAAALRSWSLWRSS